jgi:phosphate uptake regulator
VHPTGGVRSSVVHGSTKAERRAARERVSSYYDAELAKLVERVEQAIARYSVGEIDVHDVDEVIRRYARAARELWRFCWSGGSGSHLVFVARTLELWADEADQVDWWEEADRRRRR